MRRSSGMGVAWFVATVVAVTIAAAAVGSVRSEVTDVPTALGVSASRAIAASDEPSDVSNDGSDLERTPTSTLASRVEAETPESATTETRTTAETTTSATTTIVQPNAPTATTIPTPSAYTRVIDTDGGWLTVRVDSDTVLFHRAYTKDLWMFDLVSGGPGAVDARFTNADSRYSRIRVIATVTNGTLDISITPPS